MMAQEEEIGLKGNKLTLDFLSQVSSRVTKIQQQLSSQNAMVAAPKAGRIKEFSSNMFDMLDSLVDTEPDIKPSKLDEDKEVDHESQVDAAVPEPIVRVDSFRKSFPPPSPVDATASDDPEPRLSSNRPFHVRKSLQGPTYSLIWEHGLLGLRIKRDSSQQLPTVTKLTGKSSVIGIHLVEIGDYLVRVGGQDTRDLTFGEAMLTLKNAVKPCRLDFKRLSTEPRPDHPATKGGAPFTCPLAIELEQEIEKLQDEEADKLPPPIVPLMNKKYKVHWREGSLGVSLMHNRDVSMPQVTRIIKEARPGDIGKVKPGNFLVKIGSYATDSGTFNEAIQYLQTVAKPVILELCPSSQEMTNRPALKDGEYDLALDKRSPLGFTIKRDSDGQNVVADVGFIRPGKPKRLIIHNVFIGDVIVWVGEEKASDLTFRQVLAAVRQVNRPITLRIRRGGKPKPQGAKIVATTKAKKRLTTMFARNKAAATVDPVEKPRMDRTHRRPSQPVPLERKFSHGRRLERAKSTEKPISRASIREFEITWEEGTKLGLSLKPFGESKLPVVARHTGKNTSAQIVSVAPGDLLISVNGRALEPQEQFKQTLEELSQATKPATLRFRRNDPDVIAAYAVKRVEYRYEWKKGANVGLLFASHSSKKTTVVSKANTSGDPACTVRVGDTLLGIGDTSVQDKCFSDTIKVLQSAPSPVVLHFARSNSIKLPE